MNERDSSIAFKWSKNERLYLNKDIETLFREGKAFSVPNIRVVYKRVSRPEGEWSPVRLGIVVPKKRVRKAVQRNQIKRWIKEAWRLEKNAVYPLIQDTEQWHVFLVYHGTHVYSFQQAQKQMMRIIAQWTKILSHDSESS
ncbi:MAG TPA: ribonuclease P protein component [Chitinophagaceae bacterium]|nr:ribonuclease P protein component [Chitinophagaceae bacterium]